MKNSRLYFILTLLPFLAGCTGPDDREIAVMALSGLPGLFLAVFIFNFLSLAIYKFYGHEKVLPQRKKYLREFMVVLAMSIIIYGLEVLTDGRFFREATHSDGLQKWFEMWGTIIAYGAGNILMVIFLGPLLVAISNLILKALVWTSNIRHHAVVPIIPCIFVVLLMLYPLIANDMPGWLKAFLEYLVGLSSYFISTWGLGVAIALGLLLADFVGVMIRRDIQKKRPVA